MEPPVKPPKLVQYITTIFLIVAGVALMFCAMFIPPKGEIHPSVIVSFGMILTFVGTSLGIDYKSKEKIYDIWSSVQNIPNGRKSRKPKTEMPLI
ncbi:MAG: hypothetical protein J1E16_05695 [Muribaculaceae bacterium]|nr:hypothetical protein [Muribaculaceae bacterium]